ncbi:hypothetical protein DV26_28600 [Amycolatopsis mediterranei]|nr:hypothetical protein DV26_28600 [Amycolatopsis mediterranei]
MDGTSGHQRQPRQPVRREQVTGKPQAGAVPADPLLLLQRTAGHAAVGALLRPRRRVPPAPARDAAAEAGQVRRHRDFAQRLVSTR